MNDDRFPARRWATVVVVVAGIAFLVAAGLLVPWQPVPGGAPAPLDAAAVFSAAELARAEDYARWARVWGWGGLAVHLLALGALGFTRLGERLVSRFRGPWWVQVPLAALVVTAAPRVLTLPFSAAAHQHRLTNGLSRQPWAGWARDVAVSLLVSAAVTGLALLLVVALARRWRRAWPVVGASLVGALVVLGSLVYPVLVEPLFNRFTALEPGPLHTAVTEVAERQGVDVEEVLVADASRRTTTLNAYVSGIGGTRRVVLYDTLVESVPQEQTLAVVAHELAHARHQDVVVGTLLGALGAALGVGLLGLLVPADRLRGAAVVPLLMALVAFGTQVASPVENGISRRIETRADVDALKATGDPVAFGEVQRSLALRSLADPTPPALAHWWWGSHPTVLERLALAAAERATEPRRG